MTKSTGVRVRRGTRQRWVVENAGRYVCECGCGEAIPLKPEHFNVGVPRYLHGHNAKVAPPKARKNVPAPEPCACGCDRLAAPGRRYVQGHNSRGRSASSETRDRMSAAQSGERSHRYGKRSTNWKGGRTMTVHGYIEIQAPDHPYAVRGGYVREHRLVAEQHLRETNPQSEFLTPDGYLSPGADVHHINEVKHDNRVENLAVMWKGDHTRHHLASLVAARWPKEIA